MMGGFQQALIIAASFAAFYILNFALIARYAGQRRNRSWKLSYTITGFVFIILLTIQPIILPWLALYSSAGWARWVQGFGILLVAGSLLLQLWARLHLGRFYAERAEIQPGHQLIDSGPYAYIRHPLFTSYFIFITGLLLVSPTLLMFLVFLYTYWDFSQAARRDEQLMLAHMPEYANYMLRTARFFPRLTKPR